MRKALEFMKKKDIEVSVQRYGIEALGAMAQGLFASLLMGTIFKTLGKQMGIELFMTIGSFAMSVTGPAMAIAIGYALKTPPLVLFSLTAVGQAANTMGAAGGPIAVLVVSILSAEIGKAVSKETKVDILITPFVTIFSGIVLSILLAPALGTAASSIGKTIMWATELRPFFMGILVSVIVGITLTLPISSAAICASLSLTGLAGGAALAGCCAQMIGFAILSYNENKYGGLISQGLGTSMLQMKNIVKKPVVWLPIILIAAITGPIATCLFKLKMNGPAIASGMGTCGLVGPLGVYAGWLTDITNGNKNAISVLDWSGLFLVCFILPALLAFIAFILCKKFSILKTGDLKLE